MPIKQSILVTRFKISIKNTFIDRDFQLQLHNQVIQF